MKSEPNYEWLKTLKVGDKVRWNDPTGQFSGAYTLSKILKEATTVTPDGYVMLQRDGGISARAKGDQLAPATAAQFESVWDAIASHPAEAAQMKALSEAKMWFDAMAKNHSEPLLMNAQTGGALLTGHIHRINMEMLFAVCRGNKIDTETLEKICRKHNQPIPQAS